MTYPGYGWIAPTTQKVTATGLIKQIPIVGNFMSRIFKKPQTKDGFQKFIDDLCTPGARYYFPGLANNPVIQKFIKRQSMTAKEKRECTRLVLKYSINWTKAQKKSLQETCSNIRVIAEPPTPKPPEVHKVSASYNTQAQTQTVQKSRDVQEAVQAGISKIPIWVFVGIGALLILPQLLRMRGGKE